MRAGRGGTVGRVGEPGEQARRDTFAPLRTRRDAHPFAWQRVRDVGRAAVWQRRDAIAACPEARDDHLDRSDARAAVCPAAHAPSASRRAYRRSTPGVSVRAGQPSARGTQGMVRKPIPSSRSASASSAVASP